jgi:hypothetical protein
MIILLVSLQMFDELVDPIREESDLNLRRAGIVGMSVILLHDRGLLCLL